MKNVIFVGHQPSNKNVSPEIPFVGASCFNRLISWINYLKPDYYIVYNCTLDEINKIDILAKSKFKVVALGLDASKSLNRFGIQHFTLGHPSGLNRQNNDGKAVIERLNACREYIDK